jgi:two-component system, NarL family, sensor histidine kinase DesK
MSSPNSVRAADPIQAAQGAGLRSDRARGSTWPLAYRWLAWFFAAYPLVAVIADRPEPVDAALALAATALFVALILVGSRVAPADPRRRSWLAVAAVVAIVAIATVVVIHGRGAWGAFFYFASAGASPLLPRERTIALITGTGIVAGIATFAVSGDPGGSLLQGVSVAVVGLLVFTVNEARRANRALAEARDELARLAVADERARISRDLHDTLGHSLALITLKSELAGKLLPAEPERARLEIADVERTARDALASVRETVTGMTRPTLDGELAIARRTLEAANIELDVATVPEALPEAVDASCPSPSAISSPIT